MTEAGNLFLLQQFGTEHRGEDQRHETGKTDRTGHRHREFGEELLDYEEFLDLNTSDLLQRLDSILEPVFLGLGFEPLNTKTEVLAALFIDLDREQDASLFGGRTRRSEYEKMLSGNGNYEGDVMLRPLTTAMLTQYENDSRSTASMKEIMRIMNRKENRPLFGVRESASFRYND